MKKRIRTIECIVFLLVLILGIGYWQNRLQYKWLGAGPGFVNFYNKKENSIDIMNFGSSHASNALDFPRLWEEDGIVGFTLNAGAQPIDSTYYFMKEAFKTQSPRLVTVETMMIPLMKANEEGKYSTDLASLYRTDLGMRWSLDYVGMVMEQSKLYDLGHETTQNLLLRMPIVHSRYHELDMSDYEPEDPYNIGYTAFYYADGTNPPENTEEVGELDPKALEYVDRIIDLCREKGCELLFYCTPYPADAEASAGQNAVAEYLAARDIPFINYNLLYDELGFDFESDLMDKNHLNYYGVTKMSTHFFAYIKEHYDLPDRRGQRGYEDWDLSVKRQQDSKLTWDLESAQTLPDYLEVLSACYEDYDIIVTFSGNYNALGEESYAPMLQQIGIDLDTYLGGGSVLVEKGQISWWSGNDTTYDYSGNLGKDVLSIYRMEDTDTTYQAEQNTNDGLYINFDNYINVVNGPNFLVYDPDTGKVVDSAGVNVYAGFEMVRE